MFLKSKFLFSLVFIFALFSKGIQAQNATSEFPVLTGPYLGQTPPGMTPELFAPGVVSLPDSGELNSSFTPDGNEFYFTRRTEKINYVTRVMKRINNVWQPPEIPPFSGIYPDVDMCISYDGYRMFFTSLRPLPGTDKPTEDWNIWYMVRGENGWGEPQFARYPVNSGERSIYPSITYDGTIYFQSFRDGNTGGSDNSDIYRAPFINGGYPEVENLGSPVNTTNGEYDVLIAPDESYIIVGSDDQPDNVGKGDLYISFRKQDGSWSTMINMGEKFNDEYAQCCPMLSPDAKYFFFTSNRDIYWVDARIVETYKPDYLK